MTVYLCGGINGLSDADADGWREKAKRLLAPLQTIDPMSRDYRGVEDQSVLEIVHGDLRDISESRFILAMCSRPSWGTAMEIFHAYGIGKSVYLVVPHGPISPWLRYHSHWVSRSLEDACRRIVDLAHPGVSP